jgi:Mrp family chromosome partitioning ATPase
MGVKHDTRFDNMKSDVDARQFGQLRARIETTFSDRAIIVITSAARGDGKTVTAFGLAESLAEAEHRVLFVDANVEAPILPHINRLPSSGAHPEFSTISRYATPVAGQRFSGISFADQRLEGGISMEKVKSAALDMRSHFDFVIIDTSSLIRSDLAVLFTAISDAAVLTLRLGRFPSAADELTIKTLNRVGANVLGVITVTPSTIRNFASQRQRVSHPIRVPTMRPVTSRHTLEADSPLEIAERSRRNVVT